MGQLLDVCPGCIPFCTNNCCNCCIPVPPGLQRAVAKHAVLFKALGLSPQQLTVLWHKFQAFDQEASGTLRVSDFLEASGMTESIFATRAFDVLDDDGTGRLAFHEFVRALVVYCTFDKAALSLFAFDVFDFDGDGVLSGPDVQRALLEVYGSSATNIEKLLWKAKAHAQKYSRAAGAASRGPSHAFALDRYAFDELVREVPSLCFPVFTVQRRLWESCGGQTFWKRVTKERQMRAKRALPSGKDGGKTYDYHDWRGLIADIGTPTAAQKEALKEIGIATPKVSGAAGDGKEAAAAAADGGKSKTPRKSFGFPSKSGSGRRASTGGSGSMLRTMHSRKKYISGVDSPAPDEEPMDITDLERPLQALRQSDVAKVAVFGSAAERRAAAAAMGEVSERAQRKQERKRRQSAAANLSAIKQITGGSVFEEEHYKRINHVTRAEAETGAVARGSVLRVASKSEGGEAASGIGDSVTRRGAGGLASARSAASSGGSSSRNHRDAGSSIATSSKVRRSGRRSSLPSAVTSGSSRGPKYARSNRLGVSTSASPMGQSRPDKGFGGAATVTGASGPRLTGAGRRASLGASPVGSKSNQSAAKARTRARRMSQQHTIKPVANTASPITSRSRRHSMAAPGHRTRAPHTSTGASTRKRASLHPAKALELGF